jgi:hypothetical protein
MEFLPGSSSIHPSSVSFEIDRTVKGTTNLMISSYFVAEFHLNEATPPVAPNQELPKVSSDKMDDEKHQEIQHVERT